MSRDRLGEWVLRRILVALLTASLFALAVPLGALADDLENNVDSSADAALEVVSLRVSDSPRSVGFRIQPRGGDGRNGCNLSGQARLVVAVTSSNPSVATVSPPSLTFSGCSTQLSIEVDGVAPGTATITVSQTSNTSQGSFTFGNASFTVNVLADPATATPIPTATPLPIAPPTIVIGGGVGGTGGVGVGGGPNPASTPELGSLVLFGTGAAGIAGYALTRWRARRRDDDPS
jgi:hypothetical protein